MCLEGLKGYNFIIVVVADVVGIDVFVAPDRDDLATHRQGLAGAHSAYAIRWDPPKGKACYGILLVVLVDLIPARRGINPLDAGDDSSVVKPRKDEGLRRAVLTVRLSVNRLNAG